MIVLQFLPPRVRDHLSMKTKILTNFHEEISESMLYCTTLFSWQWDEVVNAKVSLCYMVNHDKFAFLMMANLKYSVMMASVTFVTTVPVLSLAIVWWLLRVEHETARSSNCTSIYISYRVSRLIRLSSGWFSELRFQSPIIKLESVLKHWWKTEQLEISLGIFSPFALFGIANLMCAALIR